MKHLDPVVGDETPEDVQREAAAATEKEEEVASIWVFAFGSNMQKAVLEVRRLIKPAESVAAIAPEYMLTFNQPGLPYREPGFATVEPLVDGARAVHGVAHLMTPSQWEYYKESEGAAGTSDEGYGVIEVTLEAYDGRKLTAYTLQTQPKSVAALRGRAALPSLRYLTLLREGAADHGLDADYQKYLNDLVHYEPHSFGGRVGGVLMRAYATFMLFPAFATMRTFRKLSMNKNEFLSRCFAKYFKFVFGLALGIHEVLRPVLGCGVTGKPLTD